MRGRRTPMERIHTVVARVWPVCWRPPNQAFHLRQYSIRLAVPEYCRAASADFTPFFKKPVCMISTIRVAQMLEQIVPQIVTHRVDVRVRPSQQPLHPVRRNVSGLLCQGPAVLATQPATSPDRYCRARRRGF